MTQFQGICYGNCDLRYVEGVLEFRKLDFTGPICQLDVKMANFKFIAKIGIRWPILAISPPKIGQFDIELAYETPKI